MTAQIPKVAIEEKKNALYILFSALAVALGDDVVISLTASIPAISDRVYHALFIGSILMILSFILVITTVRRHGLAFEKEVIALPFVVLAFGFLFDFFILNYLRNLKFALYSLQVSGQFALTLSISSVVLFLSAFTVFYVVLKYSEKKT
jgi:hypothetical protein